MQKKFDYSWLRDDVLPSRLINIVAAIMSQKAWANERQEKFPYAFTDLTNLAKVQSVKSSNAIEGIVTSDERLKAIVAGESTPQNHSEMEIAGYRDCLKLIHEHHDELDFDEKTILNLHRILLSDTPNHDNDQYKTTNNLILELTPTGERKVRFRPVDAKDTHRAMEQLTLAYLDARDDSEINQLLLIPCVILDFLCIHPFRDGNGRLSRLLSLLLLYKNGYDVGKYISFEEKINRHKRSYYQTLADSSKDWGCNKNDYAPFMCDFLRTLSRCYADLDRQFETLQDMPATKQARITQMVTHSVLPLSKHDICNFLPDVSPTTVELVLGQLTKQSKIRKIGKGKNTQYLGNPIP